jgi:hypothetical protein
LAGGAGLNQNLLREKLRFAWRQLDHLDERFSIVEELALQLVRRETGKE